MRLALALAMCVASAAQAEESQAFCAVTSASRQETIGLFTPLDDLLPSEITERDETTFTPRYRHGLFATSRQRREVFIQALRIIGSDWTTSGLRIGMDRAAVLAAYDAEIRDADRQADVIEIHLTTEETDFGHDVCMIAVTFDAQDRIAEIALDWSELRMHPDPAPEDEPL